jgi:hypothetical protein
LFSLLKHLFYKRPKPIIEPESKPIFEPEPKKPVLRKKIEFLIVDNVEEIPDNKWYRMSHWKSEHFLKIKATWDRDWKCFEREEKVVGVTYEGRDGKFLRLFDQPEFKISLEKDKFNEHDPNAVKVMGSARIDGDMVTEQLGFLSKHTAQQLKDEQELDARPYSVYLPVHGHEYGLRISVLVRSKRYRDKVYGKSAASAPIKEAWKPPPWTKEDDENLEDVYHQFGDKDFREENLIKKPPKTIIKQAVKELHKEGLISGDAYAHIDRVIDKILEIRPDLEIE